VLAHFSPAALHGVSEFLEGNLYLKLRGEEERRREGEGGEGFIILI
jgi:hypothetical protein